MKGAGAVDIAFVMVNTERYGGAGSVLSGREGRERPLPAPVFSAQDTTSFLIAIHELGHSFADPADEDVDAGSHRTISLPSNDIDLDEADVTLPNHVDRASFESIAATVKWGHFLALPGAKKHEWIHDGGYYRASGVLRPRERCGMRDHTDPRVHDRDGVGSRLAVQTKRPSGVTSIPSQRAPVATLPSDASPSHASPCGRWFGAGSISDADPSDLLSTISVPVAADSVVATAGVAGTSSRDFALCATCSPHPATEIHSSSGTRVIAGSDGWRIEGRPSYERR